MGQDERRNVRGYGYLWVPSTAYWSDLNNRLGPRPPVANDRLRHVLIGYARVSKADGSQSLDLQRDALQVEGVAAKSTVVMGEVSSLTHE